MKGIIFFYMTVISICSTRAQDVHFTMFEVAPTLLNPATAGVFEGDFRVSTNYKSQWRSVSNPFTTFSVTADGTLVENRKGNARLGGGISVYRDVAGTSRFGTTKVDLSLSSILYINEYNTASIGITGGLGRRSISPDNWQWDSQYNGQSFDASLPSYEGFASSPENEGYLDYAVGGMWSYGTSASNLASYNKFLLQLGGAYHHLSRPEQSTAFGDVDRLHSKIAVHGNMNFAAKYSKLAVRPRFTAFFQGPSREINVGTMFRYLVSEGSKYTGNVKGFAISLGGYYRIGDAFSPSTEIEYAGFTFGYSYDFNISGLTPASGGLGGHEIYLKFQTPNPFFKFSRTPRLR